MAISEKDHIEVIKSEMEDDYSDDSLFNISSWGADLSFRELVSIQVHFLLCGHFVFFEKSIFLFPDNFSAETMLRPMYVKPALLPHEHSSAHVQHVSHLKN